MKKTIILLLASIAIPTSCHAFGIVDGDGNFIWNPPKISTVTTNNPDLKVYYCESGTVTKIYPKETYDKMAETRKIVGLSGEIPGHTELEQLYQAGECKLITGSKTLTKPSYTCLGIYSNNEFLDISACKMAAETYQKVIAQGKSEEQVEKTFDSIYEKLKQQFRVGKAK